MSNYLTKEIDIEKENMRKTLQALNKALNREEITIIELAAIATFFQNSHNAIEHIIKRILIYKKIQIHYSDRNITK